MDIAGVREQLFNEIADDPGFEATHHDGRLEARSGPGKQPRPVKVVVDESTLEACASLLVAEGRGEGRYDADASDERVLLGVLADLVYDVLDTPRAANYALTLSEGRVFMRPS